MQRIGNLGTFSPKWMSASNPSCQSSGKPSKNKAERIGKAEGTEDTKKTRPSKTT